MTVSTSDVLALAEVCQKAPLLAAGRRADGDHRGGWRTTPRDVRGGRRRGGRGLAGRGRGRGRGCAIVEHSDEVAPVVHVRRACADEQSEVACGESGAAPGRRGGDRALRSGHVHRLRRRAGARRGRAATRSCSRRAPLAGSGSAGDGCGTRCRSRRAGGELGQRRGRHVRGARRRGRELRRRGRSRRRLSPRGAAALALRRVARRRGGAARAGRSGSRCGRASVRGGLRARGRRGPRARGRTTSASMGRPPGAFGRFTLGWALRDLTGQGGACGVGPHARRGPRAERDDGGRDGQVRHLVRRQRRGRERAGSGLQDRRSRRGRRVRSTSRRRASTPPSRCARRAPTAAATAGDVELGCEADADTAHRTSIERALEAGTYWVVVDGQSPNDQGPFTVEYRVVAVARAAVERAETMPLADEVVR